jgi:hypothetical protein
MTRHLDVLVVESHRGAGAARDAPRPAARFDDGDVADVCAAADDAAQAGLRRRILQLVRPTLTGAGVLPTDVTCRIEPHGSDLHVRFGLPGPVSHRVEQALAVRVLDALRAGRRTYGHVSVSVSVSDAG